MANDKHMHSPGSFLSGTTAAAHWLIGFGLMWMQLEVNTVHQLTHICPEGTPEEQQDPYIGLRPMFILLF